jgi:hypothetical protein
MQGQSNGDVGDFGWVQRAILDGLIRSGANPDHVEGLRQKVAAVEGLLEGFRSKRRQLGDSGRFTAEGLKQAELELAAPIAGEITRLLDTGHLRVNLNQKRAKLQPAAAGDVADRIIRHFTMMELRTIFQAQGVTGDPIQASIAYQQAMRRDDHLAMEALESWPLGSPVPADLIAQGQRQRQASLNPVLAKEVQELEVLHEQYQRLTRDALGELPLSQPDPIAQLAAGQEPEA